MNYTYKCNECGCDFIFNINWNNLELIKDSDKAFKCVQCPSCNSCDTRKVFNSPNIIYKGKDWGAGKEEPTE